MAIDRTGGIGDGHIYTNWSVGDLSPSNHLSRSIDGGLSFETPVPLPSAPGLGTIDVGPNGEPLDSPAVTPEVAGVLAAMKRAGKVNLIDGDDREILPGIRVYTGGKHTWESQFAGVKTTSGTVVIASDNMYLYENLEKRAPITQTLDVASNLRAQDRMKTIASKPELIVPGHDALVFTRFPGKGRVATIR